MYLYCGVVTEAIALDGEVHGLCWLVRMKLDSLAFQTELLGTRLCKAPLLSLFPGVRRHSSGHHLLSAHQYILVCSCKAPGSWARAYNVEKPLCFPPKRTGCSFLSDLLEYQP